MSNPGSLSAIEIEAEATFGENVTTFATFRLPLIGPVDCSGLKHPKVASGRSVQYMNDGTPHVLMTKGGSFKTKFHWFGHGSSTSGATTVSAFETLLGNIIGNAAASIATGTTFTGGTASVPLTTAATGFAAGSIGFAGTLGDGRGNGQAFAVSSHATNSLTLLTALDGAPNNGDVCRSAVTLNPFEISTGATMPSYRMRLLTANLRYECHGVFPTAMTIGGLNPGETPYIEVTWSVAWWVYSTATFPSTVSTDTSNPAPIAGGSLFFQDVGTVTRNKLTCRNFSVDIKFGAEPLKGPGGSDTYQDVVGWRRMPWEIKVSFTIDADAATTTPTLDTIFTGSTKKHILWTGSTANGSSVAIYMPQVCASGDRPVQKIDGNINRYSFEGMAYVGPTTTNDLTLSAIRFASA